jgi:Reverse transcriptase (RNA-dependent DNA polymerase)
MSQARYFSTMDIASAFWQIPMYPDDVHFTRFITAGGKYEWLWMPFGLMNASSTFQRFMDEVLQGLDFVVAYLDDVFVFSRTWKDHCVHITTIFDRFLRYQVKLKLAKCNFGASSVRCLGHVVENGQVRPDPENVDAIINLPEP